MVTKQKTQQKIHKRKLGWNQSISPQKSISHSENKRWEEKQKAIIDAKQLRNLQYSLSVITLKVND